MSLHPALPSIPLPVKRATSRQSPVTPISRVISSLERTGLLTPKQAQEMIKKKRDYEETFENAIIPRPTALAFVQQLIDSIIARQKLCKDFLRAGHQAPHEMKPSDRMPAWRKSLNEEMIEVRGEEHELGLRLTWLRNRKNTLMQDLSDGVNLDKPGLSAFDKKMLASCIVDDHFYAWRRASQSGSQHYPSGYPGSRALYPKIIRKYYSAQREVINPIGIKKKECYCCIMGMWFWAEYTTVAHIVPISFNGKDLSYLFGESESSPLRSERNGLVMRFEIEKAFDDGIFAIVPDGSVDADPIEYCVVLLHQRWADHTVIDTGPMKWKDLDGKRLTFQNAQGEPVAARPARRFLYFRYCLAVILAGKYGLERQLPPGPIWASPNKPCGYLRKSTLLLLADRIGDGALPQDLVESGTLTDTDPFTSSEAAEASAEYNLAEQAGIFQKKLKVGPETEEEEEEEEEEDDDEVEEEEQIKVPHDTSVGGRALYSGTKFTVESDASTDVQEEPNLH